MTTHRTPILQRLAHRPLIRVGHRIANPVGLRSVFVAEVEVEIFGYFSRSTSPNASRDFRHVDVENEPTR